MMFWSDHDMTGWGYAGMVIGMVLFWALIVVGVIALIRYTAGTAGATAPRAIPQFHPPGESPEQVLATRFARGDIDEPEYRQRLAVLRSASQP